MIVKKRRRKWEDLYVREEMAEDEGALGDAWDQIKNAVYPYRRK
jgi:hypothetical protein